MGIQKTQERSVSELLKALSRNDFLKIGMDEVAYVRTISITGSDKPVYGIYAADGTQLSVLETMDMAVATLRHNDLLPVTVH